MPSLLPFVIIGVFLFAPCDLRAENSRLGKGPRLRWF